MSLSNSAENAILALYFHGTTWDGIAENDSSTPATVLHLSLHTSDPGEAGSQTSNEATYGSYARVAVDRDADGFTVTGNQATLAQLTSFPQASSGTQTITHFGIGTAGAGAGRLDMSGTVTPNIAVATGVTPQLTTATSITLD